MVTSMIRDMFALSALALFGHMVILWADLAIRAG